MAEGDSQGLEYPDGCGGGFVRRKWISEKGIGSLAWGLGFSQFER